jgi:hypothetical protein
MSGAEWIALGLGTLIFATAVVFGWLLSRH